MAKQLLKNVNEILDIKNEKGEIVAEARVWETESIRHGKSFIIKFYSRIYENKPYLFRASFVAYDNEILNIYFKNRMNKDL